MIDLESLLLQQIPVLLLICQLTIIILHQNKQRVMLVLSFQGYHFQNQMIITHQDHTATAHHANHRFLSPQELNAALDAGIADLTAITGTAPQIVRPPFWSYDQRTFAAYQQHGLQMLLTDLSANDGKIWGVNFSFHKHSNLLTQLTELKTRWLAGQLPVVDGVTPVIVTFHDVNTYTSNHVEVYLQILLQVAQETGMPVGEPAFYNRRGEIERAALARTVPDGSVRQTLPGFWDWLWH